MIAGVADTNTAIWYRYNDNRISPAAAEFIDHAAADGSQVFISAVSLAEITYLIEKNRVAENVYADLKAALEDPEHVFAEAPLTIEIVDAMKQLSRLDVPDMPDRLIAATAVNFEVPVISRDHKIRSSSVQTIW